MPNQLKGKLLLADPSLRDGIFDRSVILLTEHETEGGAVGTILNHPIGKVVGDLLTDEAFEPLRQIAVHDGGPVDREQLTFTALWKNPQEGLRWASRVSREDAVQLARQPGTLLRAFIGYSGWTAGQLESEIKRQAWLVTEPIHDLLGKNHDPSLWATILRQLSPIHRILAEAPENPFLN